MIATRQLKPRVKAIGASAATGFFLANPLIGTFLVGVGVALYLSWRFRQSH